jgi:hypothetical protein
MNLLTISRLENLKSAIEDYLNYQFIGSFVKESLYDKMTRTGFSLMNENQFEEILAMVENQDYELAILTIENILEKAEV